jgi:4,5-dihydroxyphthalate decarboxylase
MTRLPLVVATGNYDRVRAIIDGRVAIEGCDVNYITLEPEETFFRAFGAREFDVTELSLSSYMVATSRGTCPYQAIPVFPSRMFRHSAIYIRTDRGIAKPQDLKGKRIGVPEYQLTAQLWARGILSDEYGVKASDMRWLYGGEEEPGRYEKLKLELPPEISLEPIPEGATLSAMLKDGELDGIISPRAPSCFSRQAPNVGRLFPNFREAELDYFSRTGIFPIMHVLGIRKELVEAQPWLASSVFKAFVHARNATYEDLDFLAALRVTLPTLTAELEEVHRVMGRDFWPYGFAENRKPLEAAVRYSHEQGLSKRKLTIEELFVPATLDTVKI